MSPADVYLLQGHPYCSVKGLLVTAPARISDLEGDNFCTTMNYISKRAALFNSPKSLSFNCRGQSPFKEKLQRVHIALDGVENAVGWKCSHGALLSVTAWFSL